MELFVANVEEHHIMVLEGHELDVSYFFELMGYVKEDMVSAMGKFEILYVLVSSGQGK